MCIGRKQNNECGELSENVSEEEFELLKKAVAEHEDANPHFKYGVGYPHRVVQNS